MQKGTTPVSEFGCKFKVICHQMATVGHPFDETNKAHWFLCGLGSGFQSFSTSQRTVKLSPTFLNLLSYVESHEIFMTSLHIAIVTTSVAFTANTSTLSREPVSCNSCSRSGSSSRGRRPHTVNYAETMVTTCPPVQIFRPMPMEDLPLMLTWFILFRPSATPQALIGMWTLDLLPT